MYPGQTASHKPMIGKETNLCNVLVIARWVGTECELLGERVNRTLAEIGSRRKCFLKTEKAFAGFKDSSHRLLQKKMPFIESSVKYSPNKEENLGLQSPAPT